MPKKNAQPQVRANITPEQAEWLATQNRNLSQAIRDLITRAMPGGDLHESDVDRRQKVVRFLEAVAEHYRFHKACEIAKVDEDEMTELIESDPEFEEAYIEAQSRYIDDVEDLVIQAAKGDRKIDKSAMTGLIAWLNNNHPNWGRIKTEMLQRAFGPLFKDLLRAVKKKVSSSVYKELCEEFEQIRENRFLSFSD